VLRVTGTGGGICTFNVVDTIPGVFAEFFAVTLILRTLFEGNTVVGTLIPENTIGLDCFTGVIHEIPPFWETGLPSLFTILARYV